MVPAEDTVAEEAATVTVATEVVGMVVAGAIAGAALVPAEEHTVAEEAATVAEGEAVALTFRSDDVDGVESARGGLQERQEEVRVRLQSEVAELEAELALASQKDDEATHAAQRALSDLEAARREAEEAAAEPAKKKKGGLFSRAFGRKGATTPPRSREPEDAARRRVEELERELATRRAAAEEMALARRAIAQQHAEAAKAASALGVGLGEQERKLSMQLEGARASEAAEAIPAAAGAEGGVLSGAEAAAPVEVATSAWGSRGAVATAAAGSAPPADEEGTESEDSDYVPLAEIELPQDPPVIADYMRLAKLYGYEAAPPPTFKLDWDRRWCALHPDGALWHADGFDDTAGWRGELGRLELANVRRADLSPSGEMLVLSQQGKCHLIATDSISHTTVAEWLEAVNVVYAS